MKPYLILILLLPFATASYVGFNMSVDGNMNYNSITDTPEQYNEVNIESQDSHVDISYWLDYENPIVSINQYPVYNQVTRRTANTDDILDTFIDVLNFNMGNETTDNKYMLNANFTLTKFVNSIFMNIYYNYFYPLYVENEINRRVIRRLDNYGFECEAVDEMIQEGYFVSHKCNNKGFEELHSNQSIVLWGNINK